MHRKLPVAAVLLTVALCFTTAPASATVIFTDDFNAENAGVGALNYFGFANWTVSAGTVDLIGNGFFDFYPGNGLYVDLDGSTSNAGTFTLSALLLAPGSYVLNFDLGGNARGSTDTVEVRFGGVLLSGGTFTYPSGQPLTANSLAFTVAGPGFITFENLGGDNIGLILDNVSVESVPEPGSLLLLGAGLAALGLGRRRR